VGLEYLLCRRHGLTAYRFNSALANVLTGTLEISFGVLSHALIIGAYYWQYDHWTVWSWTSAPAMALTGFLLFELFYYWKHRLGHEVNFMWAGHLVHHQSEDMNLTAGIRLSSTSPLYDIIFYIPLAVLGISPEVYIIYKGFSLVYQLFLHTELIGRLPAWYEYCFNTPSHHRVHHSCLPEHLDKNYGSVLIIYDRLFGTFATEKVKPVYGLTQALESWNPLLINVHFYGRLFAWVRDARSFRDRCRVLFGRPDQLPDYLEQPSKRGARKPKYDVDITSTEARWYLIIQFLAVVVVVFTLLKNSGHISLLASGLTTAWVFWSVAQISRFFSEPLEALLPAEVLRFFAAVALCVFLQASGVFSLAWALVIRVFCLLAAAWVCLRYLCWIGNMA